jgi:hypothetical protein
MGNDQPALHALFACELGLLELEIGLEHVFVLLTFDLAKKHDKWQNFARCPFAKTTANYSNSFRHFHILISSLSRPQRPLIYFFYFDFFVI